MKILLIGEYSNLHNTLAEGLRQLGHEVTVASNGDFWKNYPRDIDLERELGRIGGVKLMAKIMASLPKLRGYDIVQLINPMFVELKAQWNLLLYKYLKRNNRKIVLGAFGMDHYWVSTCVNEMPLRYSDFNIGSTLRTNREAMKERADWMDTPKARLNQLIAAECDAIVPCLYEYWRCYQPIFPDKTHFIPLPIKLPHPAPRPAEGKLKLFIGINKSRSAYKGTDIMLQAAKDMAAKHSDKIDLRVAESVPFNEYQHLMDGSDAILDQLYSYTPSMNSLLAMSKGIIDIGGGEPENYEILNERHLRPIVNVTPSYDSVCRAIESLLDNKEKVTQLKNDSQRYVALHHDYIKVAKQYEDIYKGSPS